MSIGPVTSTFSAFQPTLNRAATTGPAAADRPKPGNDFRLLSAELKSAQAKIVGEVIDHSIRRAQEARAERAEREEKRQIQADREARRAEQEAQITEGQRREAEAQRDLAKSDARRERLLGGLIDTYA
jgi:regulator of protease activity HflC (stomatin/prohibitin superfamily)